jgi:hypothetical protein
MPSPTIATGGLGLQGRDLPQLVLGQKFGFHLKAQPSGDGLSGPAVVAGQHDAADAAFPERCDALDRVGSRFVTQRDETDRLRVCDDDDHGLAGILQGGDAVGGKALRPAALHRMAW